MDAQHRARKKEYPSVMVEKGFTILMKSGVESFRRYANATGMPVEDIERVYNKKKYIEDPEFRKKIHGIVKGIQEKMKNSNLEFPLPF